MTCRVGVLILPFPIRDKTIYQQLPLLTWLFRHRSYRMTHLGQFQYDCVQSPLRPHRPVHVGDQDDDGHDELVYENDDCGDGQSERDHHDHVGKHDGDSRSECGLRSRGAQRHILFYHSTLVQPLDLCRHMPTGMRLPICG